MKNGLKMLWSILFLAIFLPYTAILLMNGRQGVSREEKLPDREYQVLAGLLQEDLSWMDEETLCLMAVLIRTELVRTGTSVMEEPQVRQTAYEAACDAVKKTCGKVITIDGEYRALPWHGTVPEEPVPESCWGRSILISMQWNARKTGNRKITFGYFEWIGKHFFRFCRAKIRLIRNGKSRNWSGIPPIM